MIAIVGGGICGLSIGWYLARAGRPVTVFERGEAGKGATWAAAGLLAAQTEAEPGEETLLPLMLESRAMWPEFARELEAASGMSVDLRQEGVLAVALDRDEAERLAFTYDYHRSLGLEMEWCDGARARALEPHLSPRVAAGVFSPHDHQVDNRKVAVALRDAFMAAGGMLCEYSEVEEIIVSGRRATAVRVGAREFPAECVVLAAGAWSRAIKGLPEESRPAVRPVKGQMLSLRMPEEFAPHPPCDLGKRRLSGAEAGWNAGDRRDGGRAAIRHEHDGGRHSRAAAAFSRGPARDRRSSHRGNVGGLASHQPR